MERDDAVVRGTGAEPEPDLHTLGRELRLAEEALHQPGAGAVGNLECRLADLQTRLLAVRARSLDEVATKLDVAAGLVRGLGPRGYLLELIESVLDDLHGLQQAEKQHGAGPPLG